MKRKIAYLVVAIAMMAFGSASLGCVWIFADEPKALNSINN